MSLEGKDMFMLFVLFVCFLCSDFLFLIFSQYPVQDSGGARHRREWNLQILCISLPLGTWLYTIEYPVLPLHMSSQSWYSCGLLFLLCLVDVFVFALLWFLFSYLLLISIIRFRGSKTSKGRKSSNSLHIFTFGDMAILNRVPSTHSPHVIPILVILWFTVLALLSRCFFVV